MSQIKISGANFSTEMIKIPFGIKYPFQFKLEFERDPTESDLQTFLSERLKLNVYWISPSEGKLYLLDIPPTPAGEDVLFIMDCNALQRKLSDNKGKIKIPAKDNEKDEMIHTHDHIYEGELVQLEPQSSEKGEILVQKEPSLSFHFQTIKYTSDKVQIEALNAIQQLPNSFKNVEVALKPSLREQTDDQELWRLIKDTTARISFNEYEEFMDGVCGSKPFPFDKNELSELSRKRFLPFTDTDSYRTIKVLTEFFLLVNCAAKIGDLKKYKEEIEEVPSDNGTSSKVYTIPFYKVIRNRFPELRLKVKGIGDVLDMFASYSASTEARAQERKLLDNCYGLLQESLSEPCFIELIWSYWHEEAMLVQALNAISLRFQNRKSLSRSKDPLVSMEISHLKPLNNLLWGYIQDEQHRLTVVRRAYEYDHHYGITLQGKAVPNIQGADSRKNFLEAFHMLLYRCILFYKQDDDLTVKADAFPILNALKEVHYVLSEGMHNQYGDLPFTARVEMLSQQWLLSRPELREFLPTRAMVAYPENWMGPLSTMNNLQGWTSTSPTYFNMLAVYGETLLLSIRFGFWSDTNASANQAANWTREFRPEIQGYIHAYRTVTGIDLTAPHPQTGKIDAKQPSFYLAQRIKASLNGNGGNGQVKTSANGKSVAEY